MPCPIRSFWMADWELTEDDAAALLAVLAAPPGSPGKLKRAAKRLPQADATILDAKEGKE